MTISLCLPPSFPFRPQHHHPLRSAFRVLVSHAAQPALHQDPVRPRRHLHRYAPAHHGLPGGQEGLRVQVREGAQRHLPGREIDRMGWSTIHCLGEGVTSQWHPQTTYKQVGFFTTECLQKLQIDNTDETPTADRNEKKATT